MKNKFTFPTLIFLFLSSLLSAQIQFEQATSIRADGMDADASAMLDVQSTTQGMLVPRMTTPQRDAIAAPATGLLVFDTDTGGFWFYNGADWTDLSAPTLLADADDDTKIQVEESPDEDRIRMDVEGLERVVIRKNNATGNNTMIELLDDNDNTFIGESAGSGHQSGSNNTFLGRAAGIGHGNGHANTFIGSDAGFSSGDGQNNTYLGRSAGAVALGSNNVFLGNFAGRNETGSHRLFVENSDADSANALIYGEFDNDFLRINGNLYARDGLQLPTGAVEDYLLKTDAQGNASWQPLLGSSIVLPGLGGSLNVGTNPLGLSVQGNYAYIVDNFAEDLKVVDVSDPANPSLSGSVNVGPNPNSDPRAVVAQGNYAYVLEDNANRLRVFDVSDPTNPSLAGNLGIGGEPKMLSVIGDYVYIIDSGSDDLKIVDVSNPASPSLSGSFGLGTNPRFIAVQGDYAYITDVDLDDLKVINISDPALPALSGSLGIGGNPTKVFVQGNYAYISDTDLNELKVVNISDPTNPVLSGSVGVGAGSAGLSVKGIYAYLTNNISDNLKVVDVSDPANPALVDSLSVGGNPRVLIVQGNYAYITDTDANDLKIIKLGKALVSVGLDGELVPLQSNWVNSGQDLSNTNNGNVGIGTSSPGYNLEVNGTIAASDLPEGDFKKRAMGRCNWTVLSK